MILEINNSCEFIPEFNGNKTEDKPILVKYKNPTMPLYDKLIPKPQLTLKLSPDGQSSGGESIVTIDNKAIVMAMVTSIENLEIKFANGKTLAITTAKELYGEEVPSSISGLIDEIGAHLQSVLSKKAGVDLKN